MQLTYKALGLFELGVTIPARVVVRTSLNNNGLPIGLALKKRVASPLWCPGLTSVEPISENCDQAPIFTFYTWDMRTRYQRMRGYSAPLFLCFALAFMVVTTAGAKELLLGVGDEGANFQPVARYKNGMWTPMNSIPMVDEKSPFRWYAYTDGDTPTPVHIAVVLAKGSRCGNYQLFLTDPKRSIPRLYEAGSALVATEPLAFAALHKLDRTTTEARALMPHALRAFNDAERKAIAFYSRKYARDFPRHPASQSEQAQRDFVYVQIEKSSRALHGSTQYYYVTAARRYGEKKSESASSAEPSTSFAAWIAKNGNDYRTIRAHAVPCNGQLDEWTCSLWQTPIGMFVLDNKSYVVVGSGDYESSYDSLLHLDSTGIKHIASTGGMGESYCRE